MIVAVITTAVIVAETAVTVAAIAAAVDAGPVAAGVAVALVVADARHQAPAEGTHTAQAPVPAAIFLHPNTLRRKAVTAIRAATIPAGKIIAATTTAARAAAVSNAGPTIAASTIAVPPTLRAAPLLPPRQ
jgi:hypothetical protein